MDTPTAQLFIVPTPIGNLGDITERARQVLAEVDVIAAEDTRTTNKLLHHFEIRTPTLSLHDHNERQRVDSLIHKLSQGQSIALVSDAGTPLISDPGYHLVNRVREAGYQVVPLPGACAAITALSAAGLPTDRFCFEGFLPAKSAARQSQLQGLQAEPRTMVFYEAPRRIVATLGDLCEVLGTERQVVLAREITKTFETIHGAPAGELLEWIQQDDNRQRGEMVLMVAGYKDAGDGLTPEVQKTLTLLAGELPLKKAAALTAQLHDVKKNTLYKWGLELGL